jgi:hypothetical protein
MERHIKLLKQLLIRWWDKDMFEDMEWDNLSEQVKNECFDEYLYSHLQDIDNG